MKYLYRATIDVIWHLRNWNCHGNTFVQRAKWIAEYIPTRYKLAFDAAKGIGR